MAERVDYNDLWRRIESVFQRRYEFRRKLGSGGMGLVFLVQARDLGQKYYALKVIDKTGPENSGVDVYAEIQMLKGLRHPNIVSIFEALEDDRYVFIIQDFIDGRSLAEIRDDPGPVRGFDEEDVRLWMIDTADALAYIHGMNIVHRDIKPGNIMIDSTGTARVIDFGIARRVSSLSKTRKGSTAGSAPYSPLEKLQGQADNFRTDIYAYGATFYSVLCGKIPSVNRHEINTLRASNMSIRPYYMSAYRTMVGDLESIRSDGIRELIRGCIEIDSDRRIRDFNTIRYTLRSIDQVNLMHEGKKREYARMKRLLTLVLVAGILAAGLGVVQMKRDHDHRYNRFIAGADEAYDSGDYEACMDRAAEAIAFDPGNVSGYIMKYKAQTAYAYEQNDPEEYKKIISEFNNDSAQCPALEDDLHAATYLANAYFETSDFGNAIETLRVRDDLGDDQLMLLGHAYYQTGDNGNAMECLDKMDSDMPQRYYLEGLINESADPDAAIGCYEKVLSGQAGAAGDGELRRKALSQITQIYMDRGDYSRAIRRIENETEKDNALNDSIKINRMLMDCYYQSRDYDGAIKQADVMIDRFSNSDAYAVKTSSQINLGRYGDALDTIGEWEKTYTDDPRPHIQKAMIYNNIAGSAKTDAERKKSYPDFIRVYEEESEWLYSHNAMTEEFLTLERPYYEAQAILAQMETERY